MKIETARLTLLPLTFEQLEKYLACDFSIEEELNLKKVQRQMPEMLIDRMKMKILPLVMKGQNTPFYTIWLVIDKIENTLVASFCYKGRPNINNEIEIGYSTESAFRNKGYMTEAVSGAVKWCKEKDNVDFLLAETNDDNVASIQVLIKNGFVETGRKGDIICWKIDVKN